MGAKTCGVPLYAQQPINRLWEINFVNLELT